MKKILALVLALCMVLALAACGGSGSNSSSNSAPAEKTKIGMVTDVGGVNDQSFNQSSWEGLQQLDSEKFEVNYLESKTDADYQTNIYTFIDDGYDLVICVGFQLADATRDAAEANPDQLFAIVDDDTCQDLPNVACLMFAQEQGSYLVGLIAGYVTETKTVGYVQGMVNDSMNLFGIGYISGVLDACPDADVSNQYNANNFGDIAGGSTAAKNMITKGADVIYHAAGGTGIGVINACGEAGIWAIGVDSDQSYIDPEHVLTSAMKRVDIACQDISKAVAEGKFTAGVHLYDLSNGGIDIAPTTTHIPEDVLTLVEAAKADIIAGKKTVPTTVADCPAFTLAD